MRRTFRRPKRLNLPAGPGPNLLDSGEQPYRLSVDSWEANPIFGFSSLADAIAKVIVESDPQLTLAVYGDWGLGKTTLLHAIRQRIESTNCPVAWFDMWEYQNQSHVIAHLLVAIAGALPQRSSAAQGLLRVARSAIAATSLTAGGVVTMSGKELLSEADRYLNGPKVETATLQSYLDSWLQEGTGARRRLVVVVDNLDRCLPSLAAGLLDQIAALFGFPGVVFLVAADRRRLEDAVTRAHGLEPGGGARYLEKIVQVDFRVPSLDQTQVVEWVDSLMEDTLEFGKTEAGLLAEVAGWNPRQIKRLLNNVRIQIYTARAHVPGNHAVLASALLLYCDAEVWLMLTAAATDREQVALDPSRLAPLLGKKEYEIGQGKQATLDRILAWRGGREFVTLDDEAMKRFLSSAEATVNVRAGTRRDVEDQVVARAGSAEE